MFNAWTDQYELLKLHLDEIHFLIEWGAVGIDDLQKFIAMQKREWMELIDRIEHDPR